MHASGRRAHSKWDKSPSQQCCHSQPGTQTVHFSISPVLSHSYGPHGFGAFREWKPAEKLCHTPPPSTSTLPQKSQPDSFLWVSKAHSVPEGYFVIAWNWNAKRLQMLVETRGWDSSGEVMESSCAPRVAWLGQAGCQPVRAESTAYAAKNSSTSPPAGLHPKKKERKDHSPLHLLCWAALGHPGKGTQKGHDFRTQAVLVSISMQLKTVHHF